MKYMVTQTTKMSFKYPQQISKNLLKKLKIKNEKLLTNSLGAGFIKALDKIP